MNYLAHLSLAGDDDQRVVGQFLGDFMRGPIESLPLPEGVLRGLMQHRRVDAASDRHAFYRSAKLHMPAHTRRFGNIIMDMLGDYLLHRHWGELMSGSFDAHYRRWRAILARPPIKLPRPARRFANLIVGHDLLLSYRDLTEIESVLNRIGQRLPSFEPLDLYLQPILQDLDRLDAEFPAFFQDMRDVVALGEVCPSPASAPRRETRVWRFRPNRVKID